MTWKTYKLDEIAQDLVLDALGRDMKSNRNSLNQSYTMRTTIAFGLERFWGEHLRLLSKGKPKSEDYQKGLYWQDTWSRFGQMMDEAHIYLPAAISEDELKQGVKPKALKAITRQFWGEEPVKPNQLETLLTLEDRRIAQAVLTQLCDCLVWWTQRYKDLK